MGEIPQAELTQEEVLHHSKLFQNKLAKRVSKITIRGAALIYGTITEGNHNFQDKNKVWNYIVERSSSINGAEEIVSVTRFPINLSSSVISEGMRFIIRRPKLSNGESAIEYHISTKKNPNSEPILNNMHTITKGTAFLQSI